MRWCVRSLAVVMVLGVAGPAHAIPTITTTGGDIIRIRDLPPDVAATVGFDSVGYHYQQLGIYLLDLWRWGGEFVLYRTGTGDSPSEELSDLSHGKVPLESFTYVAISSEQLEVLGGADTPWKYYCPPGLFVILAAIELLLVVRSGRSATLVLAIGGGLLAVALILYLKGVDPAFAIPLLLGVFHVGIGLLARRRARASEPEPATEPTINTPVVEPPGVEPPGGATEPVAVRPVSGLPRRSANAGSDPYRTPPQASPVSVENAPIVPATPAVVADPAAPEPKLLRPVE